MRQLKRTIRILDWYEDKLIYLFCIFLFLIGLYALIDTYIVYQRANDTSLLKYKPGYEGEAPEKEIQGNMVAWLTVDDTNIDYPVMQGKDNNEYLNKDPYGNYSLAGSIFLDNRNAPDFTDDYSVLYGHHMEGDYMFGILHSFLENSYFQQHRKGTLIVGDVNYDIHVFAVLDTDATEPYIFAPTEYEQIEVLSYIKEHAAIYEDEVLESYESEKQIVALSTCKAPDSISRVVVFGVLEKQKNIES